MKSILFLAGFLAFQSVAYARDIYSGPLIDAHVHLSANSDLALITKIYKANKVLKGVFFPREFKSGHDAGVPEEKESELAKVYAPIGWVLIGLQKRYLKHRGNDRAAHWMEPGDYWRKFIDRSRKLLIGGQRKGLGELIIRHYDYHGKGNGDNDFPIRSKVMEDLMGLSNETGRPLVFHAEGEPHVVEALMYQLPRFPKGIFVWAHACGRSDPRLVEKWLRANPNLYCDLANMTDTGNYGSLWPKAGPWTYQIEKSGVWEPGWKSLVEKFPTRFTIGSDVNEAEGWKHAWQKRIDRFRVLLGQLSKGTAAKVAYQNAQRLFGGD